VEISPKPLVPTSVLNLTTSLESQHNDVSNIVLSVLKYCQLFTHESKIFIFCAKNTSFCPIKSMGHNWMLKNPQNSLFFLVHVNPHVTHECLGRLHSPRQTTARLVHMHFCTTTQHSPYWLHWDTPNSPPKLPFPSTITTHLIHASLTNPTHHPKRHLDPICCFATIHFVDWPTDRPADRQTARCSMHMFRNMSTVLTMLIESDALISTQRLWLAKLPIRCGHVAACV